MISLLVLLPLYAIWVQHERGGNWRYLELLGLIAGPLDVFLNYTELALLTWDIPQDGEHTFSKRLSRLTRTAGWRGSLSRPIKYILDYLAPSGLHIK
jgi:hypothetical protein